MIRYLGDKDAFSKVASRLLVYSETKCKVRSIKS